MYTLLISVYSLLTVTHTYGDDYILTLKNIKLSEPLRDIEIVDVIDARSNQDDIGWVQTGLFNKKKTAHFEGPIVEEITDFLQKGNKPTSQAIPVVIKIHSFYISEQTLAMSETAKAEVSFSVYHQMSLDKFNFIQKVYGTSELNAMDVTKKHPENISMAFHEAFSQLRIDEYDLQVPRPLSRAGLLSDSTAPLAVKAQILTTKEYNEGVFDNFSEFANNSPSIIDHYEVKGGNNLKLLLLDNKGKKEREKDVYGMVYNRDLYIMFHQHFYPLEKRGNNFYFVGPKIADSGAVTTGAVLGGAIGGAIASAASARYAYKLDMSSGRLIELGEVKKK